MSHLGENLDERQRKALNRMLDAGPEGFERDMTNRKYANLTKSSSATAQRDLADLVSKGCLAVVGSGRSVRYELGRFPPPPPRLRSRPDSSCERAAS